MLDFLAAIENEQKQVFFQSHHKHFETQVGLNQFDK